MSVICYLRKNAENPHINLPMPIINVTSLATNEVWYKLMSFYQSLTWEIYWFLAAVCQALLLQLLTLLRGIHYGSLFIRVVFYNFTNRSFIYLFVKFRNYLKWYMFHNCSFDLCIFTMTFKCLSFMCFKCLSFKCFSFMCLIFTT